MRVLLIFIDGVGLGGAGPNNPFSFAPTPQLEKLLSGKPLTREAVGLSNEKATLLGLDPLLGVPGLPQSATGQTSLFTGENAPRLLGGHLKGFPISPLKELLRRRGIFSQLRGLGCRCAFINAYRPVFFDLLARGLPGDHYSCSTWLTYYGGLSFRDLEALRRGEALYMDITNETLAQMGFDVPRISPEEGGARLARLAGDYHFCLFEYFLTDLVGHSGDREQAARVVDILDRFLGALLAEIDLQNILVIVVSDHGNLEELDHSEHTANPVPGLLAGSPELRRRLAGRLKDLTHIVPAVKAALAEEMPPPGRRSLWERD
ncbi:MAG: peptidase [Dethiobacteria bacterium]